jgi:hypothetical protein
LIETLLGDVALLVSLLGEVDSIVDVRSFVASISDDWGSIALGVHVNWFSCGSLFAEILFFFIIRKHSLSYVALQRSVLPMPSVSLAS